MSEDIIKKFNKNEEGEIIYTEYKEILTPSLEMLKEVTLSEEDYNNKKNQLFSLKEELEAQIKELETKLGTVVLDLFIFDEFESRFESEDEEESTEETTEE